MTAIRRAHTYLLVFPLYDSTTGLLKTGATPAVAVNKDGGVSFVAATNTPAVEIGATGHYTITLTAAEMTADVVTVGITAAGASTKTAHIDTERYTNDDLLLVSSADYQDDAAANSLARGMAKLENRIHFSGGTLMVYKADGITPLFTQTGTQTPGEDPVTALGNEA